jgi:hypothetical protein
MNRATDFVEVSGLHTGKKAVVHLEPVGIEISRHVDPIEDRHGAGAGYVVEITLREGRKLHAESPSYFR